jgi:hypothetical protein
MSLMLVWQRKCWQMTCLLSCTLSASLSMQSCGGQVHLVNAFSNCAAASFDLCLSCVQVDLLHLHERQEVLPKLQALLEEGHAARAFAREELMTNQKQMWEMPAMHLVPHRTCKQHYLRMP